TAPWIGTGAGSIALAAGMVLIVIAAVTDSGAGYLAGSILGGAGFGAAFLGGLRALVAAIPPGHRAGGMAAFYIAAYPSPAVPAAGLVSAHLALSSTCEVCGGAVAGIALIAAFETGRPRRARMRAAAERDAVATANDIPPVTITDRHPRSPRSPAMNGTFTA